MSARKLPKQVECSVSKPVTDNIDELVRANYEIDILQLKCAKLSILVSRYQDSLMRNYLAGLPVDWPITQPIAKNELVGRLRMMFGNDRSQLPPSRTA